MQRMKTVVLAGLFLSGGLLDCFATPAPDTFTRAQAAEKRCDDMKTSGVLASWGELNRCYEENVHSIYTQDNYPNPDLVDLLYVKYTQIHADMDARRISVSEGLERKKHVLDEINAMISERMTPRLEA